MPIPVTVLTGFLGSGKSTLLKRILTERHGHRIAVIQNEFGEIGIDGDLVIPVDEELYELNNGCVCCSVRGDLLRVLFKLSRRRPRPDAVVIETTGLADPGPVIQTFLADAEIQQGVRLDAIATLVDCKHILLHLDKDPECARQIGFADVLLLNKIDLVSTPEADALEARLRSMNALARIFRASQAAVPLDQILGIDAFELSRKLEFDPQALDETSHGHSDVTSMALRSLQPLDTQRTDRWLQDLITRHGPGLYRMKGVLHLQGDPRRFIFQGVHSHFAGNPDLPWAEGEARETKLVLIGRDLDATWIRAGFASCQA